MRRGEAGSAIFILFVAVALFAGVGYAFLQSSRTSVGWFQTERTKAGQTAFADCQLVVAAATKRLQLRGCGNLISNQTDGSNPNPGAPVDGSCSVYHPNGGGAKNCMGIPTGAADVCQGSPSIGTVCADGTIYAGITPDGNIPMYAAPYDQPGTYAWGTSGTLRGVNNVNTGEANTATLAAFGAAAHPAAYACATLTAQGYDDWYLPAHNEIQNFWNSGNFLPNMIVNEYWASREVNSTNANRMSGWGAPPGTAGSRSKSVTLYVRCVRK